MNTVFQNTSKILLTCPKRISSYLREEVQELGYIIDEEWITGVALTGKMRDCMHLNIHLRTANHVLFLLKEFDCNNPDELYAALNKMEWENLIEATGYFSVTCNVDTPSIDNTMFANVKVKDAIVDRIREKNGVRPDTGPNRNKAVIHLFWKDDKASVFIDTSGETLAKHNYRKVPHLAPMQEGLAAATILSTRWNKESNFVNPMCGSGTLAIEAALIALNKAPGLLRTNYGFMHIKGYNEEVYESERKSAKEKAKKKITGKIIATDIDPRAIESAKANAQTAGVDHIIEFDICDFRDTNVPQGEGIVMFNPEYGERLGNYDELEETYKAMGDFLKQKCKGYRGYILTSAPNLAKKVGLRASRKIEFYNSKLDCRLLEYELYEGTKRDTLANG
jgi:putative N6-adenine-specific DNA methylase